MFRDVDLQLNRGFISENSVYTGVGFHRKFGFKIFCVYRCRFSP